MDSIIQAYGLPVIIIACIIIAFVGILKVCKVFDKITNKSIKRFIFFLIDIALSFGFTAIYYLIFKVPFAGFVLNSAAQCGFTLMLYSVYEGTVLKDFVKYIWTLILKSDKSGKLVKLAKNIGLDTAIAELQKAKTTESTTNTIKQ